ncbi:MAG: heparinase II/III family protein [Kiloniellaceae bacterium]
MAGFAGRLRDLAHLPREQALSRLGYGLKRPVFALPFYRYSLPGLTATALAATPTDPWPGNAELGAAIVRGEFSFAGPTPTKPEPPWALGGTRPWWLAEPHGFAWLRDLRAAGGDAARRRARALVRAWVERHAAWSTPAWDPLATGRRLAHWLGCYEFFAASAEIEFRQRLLASIAQQAQHLCRVLPAGLAGAELIAALKGLIYAGVALPGGEAWRARGLEILRRELPRQVLSDGGHVERSPSRHLAVLRDLIDVRAALRRTGAHAHADGVPAALHAAIEAMAPALRMFQHGDGGLALFNGSVEEEGWQVELVLQRAGGPRRPLAEATDGGFQRMCAGRTVALIDAGAAPGRGLDRRAHAGTLGLEVSVGRERLIVSCGARPGDPAWERAQRATAAHSTLVVEDTNSSEILPGGGFGRAARIVHCRRAEAEGRTWLDLAHDGYARGFGLIHRRRLYLGADGSDLRGEDRLEPIRAQRRGGAFALRFHLHPTVRASVAQSGDTVLLRLPKGGGWQLRTTGAQVALEQSIYLGHPGQIRRSRQIVLSGAWTARGARVKWALRRLEPKRA